MLALWDTRARLSFSCGSGEMSGTGKQAREDAFYLNDDGMSKVSHKCGEEKNLVKVYSRDRERGTQMSVQRVSCTAHLTQSRGWVGGESASF